MLLIKNNPYRILGLLVGAKATQLSRHVSRIPRYIEAGDDIPTEFTEFSFDCFGAINRTPESVASAASQLTLDKDKLNAALFWFYIGNPITDEPALDSLKEGLHKEASEIWNRLVNTKEITQKNASAFQNLSTLYLLYAFKSQTVNKNFLVKAISLKLQFLESDFINDFKTFATDITFEIDKKNIQLLFLNQVKGEIERYNDSSPSILVETIMQESFSAKDEFLKGFIQKPTESILQKTTETQRKRKEDPSNAEIFGNELYEETHHKLDFLAKVLGNSHFQYQNIADKVAEEILQCGIDFFEAYKDEEYDPADDVMGLFDLADSIAIGGIVKQRCEKNRESLQEWIIEKPKREKQKKIKIDLDLITRAFNQFDNNIEEKPKTSRLLVSFDASDNSIKTKEIDNIELISFKSNDNRIKIKEIDNIERARKLIIKCKPILINIKSVLGGNDDLYLKLCTQLAQRVQNNIVENVNSLQKALTISINFNHDLSRIMSVQRLKETLLIAWDVTNMIGVLDLENNFKATQYEPSKKTLKDICQQLGVNLSTPKQRLKKELDAAYIELDKIKEWQFLRAESDRQKQINEQQLKITTIQKRYNEAEY